MTTYLVQTSGQYQITTGSNCLIDNLALTNPLPLAYGGLGSACSTQADMQTAIGLVLGSTVEAWSANLDQLAALTPSDGQLVSWSADSGSFVAVNPSGSDLSLSAGNGLNYNGSGQFSVNPDGVTLDLNGSGNSLEVAQGGINANCLSSGVVDNATLTGGAGAALSIASNGVGLQQLNTAIADGSSLDFNGSGGTLEIASGGVNLSKLSTGIADGVTLDFNGSGNTLEIASAGVHIANINYDCLGDGLSGGEGTAINIADGNIKKNMIDSGVYDGTTIAMGGSGLYIPNNAITASKLSGNVVDNSTIVLNGSNQIKVKDGSIGVDQVGTALWGSGLTGGDGTQVSVDYTAVFGLGDNASFAHNLDLTNSGAYLTVAPVAQFQNNLLVQPSGMSGFSQFNEFEVLTTDNTSTTLASLGVSNNAVTFYHCELAFCDDAFTNYGMYFVDCVVQANDGSLTVPQTNVSSIYASSGIGGPTMSINGANLDLNIVGASAVNLRWNASVKQVCCPKYSS